MPNPSRGLQEQVFLASAEMVQGMLTHDDVDQVLMDLKPSFVQLAPEVIMAARVSYLILRDLPFEVASELVVNAMPGVIADVEVRLPDLWAMVSQEAQSSDASRRNVAGGVADLVVCLALVRVAQSDFQEAFRTRRSLQEVRTEAERVYQGIVEHVHRQTGLRL